MRVLRSNKQTSISPEARFQNATTRRRHALELPIAQEYAGKQLGFSNPERDLWFGGKKYSGLSLQQLGARPGVQDHFPAVYAVREGFSFRELPCSFS